MNTILRSKMEREIGFGWEIKIESVYHSEDRRIVFKQSSSSIYYFCENADSGPAIAPMYSIVEVCPPGGEWLEVVDDPKAGSVWEHDGGYRVVTSYGDEVEYTFYGTNGEQWNATLHREAFVNECKPVDSSRIIEGMDGGRLRKFVKTGTFKHGPWQRGEWFLTQCTATPEPEKIQNCNWYWLDGGEREILIPLNFIDPAPCISSVHKETELEGGTKRLATCKESFQVDPLSWDANPPMVGDIVAGNTLHRPSLIGYVDTCGKVSLCCSARGIPHDEFVAAYRRLALSPLHKEAGRRHDRTLC